MTKKRQTNAFKKYAVDSNQLALDIQKEGANYSEAVTRVQGLIMAVAYEIEHGQTVNMTNLIHAFSVTDKGGFKLTEQSRQIGKYMKEFLPIKWHVKDAKFVMDEKRLEEFAWRPAMQAMERTPWHTFKVERPEVAFDAGAKFNSAMGILRQIVKHAEIIHDVKADDKAYKKAVAILKTVDAK